MAHRPTQQCNTAENPDSFLVLPSCPSSWTEHIRCEAKRCLPRALMLSTSKPSWLLSLPREATPRAIARLCQSVVHGGHNSADNGLPGTYMQNTSHSVLYRATHVPPTESCPLPRCRGKNRSRPHANPKPETRRNNSPTPLYAISHDLLPLPRTADGRAGPSSFSKGRIRSVLRPPGTPRKTRQSHGQAPASPAPRASPASDARL